MKINIRSIIQILLIYIMLIGNRSSLLVLLYREKRVPVAICVFLIAILISVCLLKRLDRRMFSFWCAVFVVVALVFIFTKGTGAYNYFDIIAWPTLVAVAYKLDTKKFIDRYVKVVVFFAAISLICYFLQMSNIQSLFSILGKPYNDFKMEYRGAYFYTYTLVHNYRNMGMYTEPGLYQIVVNSALYILLFLPNSITVSKTRKIVMFAILVATCVTTLSTTGFMTLAVVFLGAVLSKQVQHKKMIVALICIVIAYLAYNFYAFGNESIISMYIIDKLEQTGTSQLIQSTHLSSGNARIMAFGVAVRCMMSYPLGAGYYNYTRIASSMGFPDIAGNGLAMYAGEYGILMLFIIFWYIIKPIWKDRPSKLHFWVFLAIYLLYTTSQEYLVIPSLLVFGPAFQMELKNRKR